MKCRVGRDDTTGSSATISVVRWANELSFLALFELSDSLVPAFDDLASADNEFKWLAALVA